MACRAIHFSVTITLEQQMGEFVTRNIQATFDLPAFRPLQQEREKLG
jgi:hypothetical protein